LAIGYFGGRGVSMMVDIHRMKTYLDLPDNEIIKYAMCINANFQKKGCKKTESKINKAKLAISYYKMISSGTCKNRAELARMMNVSRAWITKVMKFLPVKE
jgi:hypothetical protein